MNSEDVDNNLLARIAELEAELRRIKDQRNDLVNKVTHESVGMSAQDVELAIRKAVALSHEHWGEHGEPVRPDSKEAEILVAEALNAVLHDMIEKRKRETQ